MMLSRICSQFPLIAARGARVFIKRHPYSERANGHGDVTNTKAYQEAQEAIKKQNEQANKREAKNLMGRVEINELKPIRICDFSLGTLQEFAGDPIPKNSLSKNREILCSPYTLRVNIDQKAVALWKERIRQEKGIIEVDNFEKPEYFNNENIDAFLAAVHELSDEIYMIVPPSKAPRNLVEGLFDFSALTHKKMQISIHRGGPLPEYVEYYDFEKQEIDLEKLKDLEKKFEGFVDGIIFQNVSLTKAHRSFFSDFCFKLSENYGVVFILNQDWFKRCVEKNGLAEL